ncbi:MAG: inorganic diphosphatase [Longimicrobiales bacterium]
MRVFARPATPDYYASMRFNAWHDLPAGPAVPDHLNVIIEIPRGSRNKYELDKDTGLFRFDRLLYSAVYYPGDYGFVPQTLADDDDPLDVLVMVTVPTFPGCLVAVRPVGVFEMSDEKGHDEKILAVPVKDPLYDEYQELTHVPKHFLREVEHFFAIYKELEGVQTNVIGWRDRDVARTLIQAACTRYSDVHGLGRTTV